MGISGLLPFLKKASKKSHIRHFSGYTVAVDASCWLHKGAFGCAQKLGTGEPTVAYVTYFVKYVNILRENGLRPILVFDGRSLPSKEGTNKKRREKREENKVKAKEALRVGNKREAWECFQRAIEITPSMVREVIKVLRQEKLDYIISPYEADAQMAYLSKKGIVDLVITEDSDLVLFGCPRIFFKMNSNGEGVIFDQSRLHLCMDQTPEKFQFEKFRQMCIFSGCDYLESLAGIGLARAKKVFTLANHDNLENVLKQTTTILKIDITVNDKYIDEFRRAENTFLYQLVYDPRCKSRGLCPLTPYLSGIAKENLSYCGKYEDAKLSLGMALGNIDIRTLERVNNFNMEDPKSGYCTEKSMWSAKYKNIPRMALKDNQEKQKNSQTKSPVKRKTVSVTNSHDVKNRVIFKSPVTIPEMEEDQMMFYKREDKRASGSSENLNGFRPAKRACLRSFYASSVTPDGDNGNNNDEVENLKRKSPLLTERSGTSSMTDSDDSSMTRLRTRKTTTNPFVVKFPESITTKVASLNTNVITQSKKVSKLILRAGLSKKPIFRTSSGRPLTDSPETKKFPVEAQAMVVVERIDSTSNKSIFSMKRQSQFFIPGNKDYVASNHPLFHQSRENEKRSAL